MKILRDKGIRKKELGFGIYFLGVIIKRKLKIKVKLKIKC